jgi:uncharacterized membrane protein YfcA
MARISFGVSPAARTSTRTRLAGAAVVGLLAGFLSGLFGVGGGILIVPGLVLVMKMDQRLAHGTSLAAILPIAAAGVVGYAVHDAVDWPVGAIISVGAIVGALIGVRFLRAVRGHVLRNVFAIFLVATAARLLIDTPEPSGRGPLLLALALSLIVIGLVSGATAGLLGVGGGIIIIPALVVLFAVPDPIAKGTSLFVIIPTALAGTVQNTRADNVDMPVAIAVGLAGAVAAFAGSKVATTLSPHLSSVLFAGLILVVAARMLLVRQRPSR